MHSLDYSDNFLRKILKETKTIAIVGASIKQNRPSYKVAEFLINKGYKIFPINPLYINHNLHEIPFLGSLSDIKCQIDMVDVFRRSEELEAIVDEAIRARTSTIWTQLEIIDFNSAKKAKRFGLKVVMDRCPAIEIPRLFPI